MDKDFYKVLGVNEGASPDEIKRAYKLLARKHHPDTNKDKNSEERFKEISEAYETLGNPESKREYDLRREAMRRGYGGSGMRWETRGSPFDFESDFQSQGVEDLLSSFFGGRTGNFSRRSGFGTSSPGFQTSAPRTAELKVPLKMACTGGRILVSGIPGGSRHVEIPQGSVQHSVVRLNLSGGPFELKILIEDEPPFTLKDEKNIETSIKINLAQALLGGKVKFRDPRNAEFILTIPPGSQPGDILKLKGLGLSGGDLLVKLDISVPKNLSEEEKHLFTAFAVKAGLID
ncbi:MAG: J domain-containing protein [Candidatus Riflebacteria bacterium]|nr:J domain-containing protein [Candidatus Riflebacteria bacterium]